MTYAIDEDQPVHSRAQNTMFARHTQTLGYSWRDLTPGEVDRLVAVLKSHHDQGGTACSPLDREAFFAIAACLTTGRHLHALAPLSASRWPSWPLHEPPLGMVRCGDSWGWLLPPGRPPSVMKNSQEDCIAPLWLPAPALVVEIGSQIRPGIGSLRSGEHRALFDHPLEEVGIAARRILRRDPTMRRASITLESVERWLSGAIIRSPGGDTALARIVTGRAPFHAKATSHYSGCGQTGVENAWWSAMSPVIGKTEAIGRRAPSDILSRRRYGSPFVPSVASMATLAKRSYTAIRRAPSLLAAHNAMTIHTALLCTMGLALRPSRRPIVPFNGVDPETGFVILADDRERDQFMVRMGWAPPVLRTQLDLYRRHLSRLATLNEAAAHALSTCCIDGSMPWILFKGPIPGQVTFRDVVDAAMEVRTGELRHNFARHLLRTELLGQCSSETLHAFMGHWNTGTEPWGTASGFDPMAYRADLERALPPLLEQTGWLAAAPADRVVP